MTRPRLAIVSIFGWYLALHGCTEKGQPITANVGLPATAPSKPITWSSKEYGVALTCPAGWKPQPSADYVLMLVSPTGQSLSLDVPHLPFHLPGMIRVSLVRNGYLDNLRKQFPTLHIDEDTPTAVPDAEARLVLTSWTDNGRDMRQAGLLIVHADRVYILRALSDADSYHAARAAFDEMAHSLHWIR